MPGLGFLVGGLVTAGHSPRTAFLVAGVGVLVVVSVAAYYLAGTPWTRGEGAIGPSGLDENDESDMFQVEGEGKSLAHVGGRPMPAPPEEESEVRNPRRS
jgi:hypothetical protein